MYINNTVISHVPFRPLQQGRHLNDFYTGVVEILFEKAVIVLLPWAEEPHKMKWCNPQSTPPAFSGVCYPVTGLSYHQTLQLTTEGLCSSPRVPHCVPLCQSEVNTLYSSVFLRAQGTSALGIRQPESVYFAITSSMPDQNITTVSVLNSTGQKYLSFQLPLLCIFKN